jgi:hypothetical protein
LVGKAGARLARNRLPAYRPPSKLARPAASTDKGDQIMRTSGRLLLAGLTGALALAAAVGTASARQLQFSSQTIRTAMTLRLEAGITATSVCPVTLEGSFHSRIISKLSGDLIGYITSAATEKARCTSQRSLFFAQPDSTPENESLPWHIRYDSFTGTLPRITGIRLQLIGLKLKILLTSCEFQSSTARPAYLLMTVAAETGRIEAIRFLEESSIPRIPITGSCPQATAILAGRELLTVLGTTTSITVSLVQ